MKKNIPQHMYIGRHEKPRKFWLLRFRHGGKTVHRQQFNDDKYSTSEHALLAALEKRGKLALEYGVDLSKHWNRCKQKSYRYTQRNTGFRSKTGVIGVTLSSTGIYDYYRASISFTQGVETVKNFNINRWGKREAFKKAVLQRKKWEKELLKNNTVNI